MINDFKHAMSQAGLLTKEAIIADGKLHRFHVDGDKAGSKNGWYVLYNGDLPAGCFGNWKTGIKQNWCSKNTKALTLKERRTFKEKMRKASADREAELKTRHKAAREKAQHIWDLSKPAPDSHPYLQKKQIKNHGLRLYGEKLVIPLCDSADFIQSLQFIDNDGGKLFLSGGRKKGCYFTINGLGESLLIAEGYATAATLHESMSCTVIIAFDSGNLMSVAQAVRAKYSARKITICADNDLNSKVNIGLTKGRQAAEAIGAFLSFPPCAGDFNDFYTGSYHE